MIKEDWKMIPVYPFLKKNEVSIENDTSLFI